MSIRGFVVRNHLLKIGILLLLSGCGGEPPAGMVLVASGYFSMGSSAADDAQQALALGLDKPWFADETPLRRLTLPDFYIDRHEVINRHYYIFCQATDHHPPPIWRGPKYPEGQDDFPVTTVSFYDAAAYAEWAGKRLPTEQEWEKAARGPNENLYPWGDRFDFSKANISQSPRQKIGQGLKPVGQHPAGASVYGAEDMIGNVWEWVWDYYQPYPDNTWPAENYAGKKVVVRGLSFLGVGHFSKEDYQHVMAMKARVSYREKLNPQSKLLDVGFRCMKKKPTLYQSLFDSDS